MKIENLTSNHPDFLPRQSIGMKNRYRLLNLVLVAKFSTAVPCAVGTAVQL